MARRWGALVSVPFGVLAGYLSYHYLSAGWWLIAAVALPYLSHPLADSLTVGGVPLLMPFTKRRLSLGLMKTGHLLERVVFTPLIMVAAVAACWVAFEPAMQELGPHRLHDLGAAGRGGFVASERAPCGDRRLTLRCSELRLAAGTTTAAWPGIGKPSAEASSTALGGAPWLRSGGQACSAKDNIFPGVDLHQEPG